MCIQVFRYFLWIKILWQLPNILIWRHWIWLHLKIRGTSIYMFHTQTFQNCSPIKWKIHSKNLCNILRSTVDGAYTRPCKVAFFQNSITCHHQNQPPPNVASKSQLPSDVLLQPPSVADQDQGASIFVIWNKYSHLKIFVQWNIHNHPIIQMVLVWYLLLEMIMQQLYAILQVNFNLPGQLDVENWHVPGLHKNRLAYVFFCGKKQ